MIGCVTHCAVQVYESGDYFTLGRCMWHEEKGAPYMLCDHFKYDCDLITWKGCQRRVKGVSSLSLSLSLSPTILSVESKEKPFTRSTRTTGVSCAASERATSSLQWR